MMQKDKESLISWQRLFWAPIRKEYWEKEAEEEACKKNQKEDKKFIKESGVLDIFGDVRAILSSPGRTFLDFGIPNGERLKCVQISFIWDWNVYNKRTKKELRCFVARQDSRPIGFCFNNSKEIIPAEKEIFSNKLVEIIKSTPLTRF